MKRRLAAFPAEALQHLGLLTAFILLLAANEFAAAHPALAAVLIFAFSLPYLAASVVTRRTHFLYATMLLGAVAYFLACYALGAPPAFFPILSLPLVAGLWAAGRVLGRRLPESLKPFPTTVFRAMSITVAVFAVWALVQVPRQMAGAGLGRGVAGATFLGYSALYLAHAVAGAAVFYVYVFSLFLILGALLTAAALSSIYGCWLAAAAAAAALFYVGARLHRARTYAWSRHCYASAAAAILVSLAFSVLRWTSLLHGLAAASLVLGLAYEWLRRAVSDVRRAKTAERALARGLFLGSLAFGAPAAPLLLLAPANPHVAATALVFGLIFAWAAWQRRSEGDGSRSLYALPAAWFLAAALFGAGRAFPYGFAAAWSLASPAAFLLAAGLLARRLDPARCGGLRRGIADGSVFAAFFAWYIPLLGGEPGLALASALIALAGVVALGCVRQFVTPPSWRLERRRPAAAVAGKMPATTASGTLALHAVAPAPSMADSLAKDEGSGASSDEGRFLRAAGPAGAGALVAALVWAAGSTAIAWTGCALAAAAAGAGFVWAGARKRETERGATHLAWLVLSMAAAALAAARGTGPALCSVTGMAFVALLMAGWCRRQGAGDLFARLVGLWAALFTAATVVLGPFSGWGPARAGACLLLLAGACGASWAFCQALRFARAAAALFALGSLLVIFGLLPAGGARIGTGAALAGALFAVAFAARRRFPEAARSWAVVGHLAALVLACAALAAGWAQAGPRLALSLVPYVLLYGLLAWRWSTPGFRFGTVGWLTLLALFAAAASSGVPYRHLAPLVAMLALVWLGLGYGLMRRKAQAWTGPLFTAAAVLAAFCGALSVFSPAAEGSWRVFLVNGIVFATLFLILRQDLFAYLLTMSLALLAYDWVKASTSRFTQDVLFYLVIGTAVLGVFFLLPYLKRVVDRIGTLPMVSIFTWRGAALTSVPVVCGAGVLLFAYSVKLTEHPKFCLSCHYMGAYYESWQHSSHRNVACVQCHYEPGVEAELRGKVAGLVQLVKYVAHAYSSKPHAQISNRSCLREGCHAGMDHSKETLLFQGKIRFRHERHLSGHPRGKELNCVSCHGQMVEGQHISVTVTTCLTCHFYGRGENPTAAGECTTCHEVPAKAVRFAGQAFRHREFLKDKTEVNCIHCHTRVTRGDGAVSPTRCQNCHLQRTRPAQDITEFHLVHVSKGHFQCLQCHEEIKHGGHMMANLMMASSSCEACHSDRRHSVQQRLYAGTAVPGLKPEPDIMFKAGVACDGCHTGLQLVNVGNANYTTMASGAKQCASCHGDKAYGDMLAEWQNETKKRLGTIRPALAELEKILQGAAVPRDQASRFQQLLAAAKAKVECVVLDGSFGAHNTVYVASILDAAEAEIRECRDLLRAAQRPGQGALPRPQRPPGPEVAERTP